LRPECFVTQIETDRTGRVTGVVYRQNGQEYRQRCRAVFLCAGAIETPRLLLLNGLANGSGQVGRSFLAHCGLQIWGDFEEDVRPYKGIPGGLISEDTHRPQDADFAGGYLLQSIGVMPVTYASQMARGIGAWGAAMDARMRAYNRTAGINICGECLPADGNFLTLSDEKDRRGLPKPHVQFTNGENERRLTAHAERLMRVIWAEAGARNVWAFPRNAHTLGTCRMGTDPATSVVDADGRCHDVPNLYVMDNSVYPSSLSVNPALTQMALSLRAADRFLERVQRGEG
jgi:choline dehydrogenase-like flavoprotein